MNDGNFKVAVLDQRERTSGRGAVSSYKIKRNLDKHLEAPLN